eukprot:1455958-Amphidinium_carterae.2
MLRDAHLGKAELDTIHQWAQGDFAYDKTVTMLRNLDRLPQAAIPASSWTKTILYDEEEEEFDEEGTDWGIEAEYEQAWGEQQKAQFEYDGATAEEIGDAEAIPEDVAQILAAGFHPQGSRYQEHRKDIQSHKLQRGFTSSSNSGYKGSGTGKGSGKNGKSYAGRRPWTANAPQGSRDRSLAPVIARTRCADAVRLDIGQGLATHPRWLAAMVVQTGSLDKAATFASFFIHTEDDKDAKGDAASYSSCLLLTSASESSSEFLGILDTGAQTGVIGEKR